MHMQPCLPQRSLQVHGTLQLWSREVPYLLFPDSLPLVNHAADTLGARLLLGS